MQWIAGGGKVSVDAKTLMLEPLLRIYNDDPSPTKDQANRYLAYIHLVSQIDPEAPYFRSSHLEVRALAKRQLFRDESFDFGKALEEFLEKTIKDYQEAYEDSDSRAERIFNKKIDQMITEIDRKEPEIVRTSGIKGQVIFVSNVDLINKAMKSLPDLLQIRDELRAKIKRFSKDEAVIRGGKKESVLLKRDARLKLTPHNNEQSQATPQGTGDAGKTVQLAPEVKEGTGT